MFSLQACPQKSRARAILLSLDSIRPFRSVAMAPHNGRSNVFGVCCIAIYWSVFRESTLTDEQLARNLRSVGLACFVEYFECFASNQMSRAEIVDRLRSETGYTNKSCISRTGHAISIIQAGLAKVVLRKIIASNSQKVSESTRAKSQRLLGII